MENIGKSYQFENEKILNYPLELKKIPTSSK